MKFKWFLAATVCGAATLMVTDLLGLDCAAENSENVRLAPVEVRIDGTAVETTEFGDEVVLMASYDGLMWMRVTSAQDEGAAELSFQREGQP